MRRSVTSSNGMNETARLGAGEGAATTNCQLDFQKVAAVVPTAISEGGGRDDRRYQASTIAGGRRFSQQFGEQHFVTVHHLLEGETRGRVYTSSCNDSFDLWSAG